MEFFFVQALLRVFRSVPIVAKPFSFPPITLQTRESRFSALAVIITLDRTTKGA